VRRRFLDRLEQGVERGGRELVNLVDDEDLVAVADRHDAEAGDDHFADVVDLGVGGSVDFQNIDVASLRNLHTGVTRSARIRRRTALAAQRACEDPRRRGLADAARSCEHERLRQPPARQRVAQRTRHRVLTDDILEALRPPLARDDLVGHQRTAAGALRHPAWTGTAFRFDDTDSRFGRCSSEDFG
jgi:hypothetical protein